MRKGGENLRNFDFVRVPFDLDFRLLVLSILKYYISYGFGL